jgi:hypothetical protein
MKSLSFAAMAAGTFLAMAAPSLAAAQPYDRHDWDRGGDHRGVGWGRGADGRGEAVARELDRRIDWMQRRIDRGRQDGSLDRGEAWRIQGQLDQIRSDARRMRNHNGGDWLRGDQRDRLTNQLNLLNGQIHWLRNNDDRRPW